MKHHNIINHIISNAMDVILINYIVASTNLIALYYVLYYKMNMYQIIQIILPVCASFIYHLSETKRGLVGLYPINKYSELLLYIDRFFAILSFITCLYKVRNNNIDKQLYLTYGIIGLSALIISERDIIYDNINLYHNFIVNKYEFLCFHSLWHIIAFNMLCSLIMNK